MEEEDEGSKFCEEDIDQILLRRTKTITIESEGRGSTFAKVYSEWYFINMPVMFTTKNFPLLSINYVQSIYLMRK